MTWYGPSGPVITVLLRVRFMFYFLLFQVGRQQKCLKAEEVLTPTTTFRSSGSLSLVPSPPLPGRWNFAQERRRGLDERRLSFCLHQRERERDKGKEVGGNFSSLACHFSSTDNCKSLFASRVAAKLSIPHRTIFRRAIFSRPALHSEKYFMGIRVCVQYDYSYIPESPEC